MVKVIFFDLGLTLLDAHNRPYPHATQALASLAKLPVKSCLVSDYDMSLSVTQAMKDYSKILVASDLKSYFEPVKQHVTLSNHVGLSKPHPSLFKKALERLGEPQVAFTDCLFITENAAHIHAVSETLHMATLQFGVDFTDWSEFELKLAPLLEDQGQWHAISVPGHPDLGSVLVQVTGTSEADLAEVQCFVASLADNGRIAGLAGKTAFQPTHALECNAQGQTSLVRKRFTSIKL
jgi:hypothetical protein